MLIDDHQRWSHGLRVGKWHLPVRDRELGARGHRIDAIRGREAPGLVQEQGAAMDRKTSIQEKANTIRVAALQIESANGCVEANLEHTTHSVEVSDFPSESGV